MIQRPCKLTIEVGARDSKGTSKIFLHRGDKFTLNVPEGQKWIDCLIPVSPKGWDLFVFKPFNALRKRSGSKFMRLMWGQRRYGAVHVWREVNLDGPTEYVAKQDGYLCLIPNDIPILYWNNLGSIEVEVTLN